MAFQSLKSDPRAGDDLTCHDVGATATYARQCFASCYGHEVWTLQMDKLRWPDELRRLACTESSNPNEALAKEKSVGPCPLPHARVEAVSTLAHEMSEMQVAPSAVRTP